MNASLILYPSIAMFALTLACVVTLGLSRYRAIRRGEVRISYYRSYDEGTQPKRLHLLSRHVQNHFEVPPLFHIGVVLLFVTASTSGAALWFAWLYVLARLLHTWVHLGSNNVTHRFVAFGFSLLMLLGLWTSLLVVVAGRSG